MSEPRPTERPTPTIRGELVYLRPAERDDLDRFVRWFADGETTRNLLIRAPFNRAMEEQWFEAMVAAQGKTDYHFVICRLADDEPIGTVGLHDLDFVNGNAEFGISIGEKGEWNKGYGTDALRAICDFGFGELRLERIELEVYAGNARGAALVRESWLQPGGDAAAAPLRRGPPRGRADHVAPARRVGRPGSAAQLGAQRARLTAGYRGMFELRRDPVTGWWSAIVTDRAFEHASFTMEAAPVEGTHCRHCDDSPEGDDDAVRRVVLRPNAFEIVPRRAGVEPPGRAAAGGVARPARVVGDRGRAAGPPRAVRGRRPASRREAPPPRP